MALKGQNLRVFIGSKCVAASTSCSIHLGTSQDDATTKDSTGDWDEIEITGKNWDISVDSLFSTSGDGNGLSTAELLALHGTLVTLKFDETQGEKNRTAKNTITHTGQAYLIDINIQAGNRQKVTTGYQFKGTGPLT